MRIERVPIPEATLLCEINARVLIDGAVVVGPNDWEIGTRPNDCEAGICIGGFIGAYA